MRGRLRQGAVAVLVLMGIIPVGVSQGLEIRTSGDEVIVSSPTRVAGQLESSADLMSWSSVASVDDKTPLEFRTARSAESEARFFRFIPQPANAFSEQIQYREMPQPIEYMSTETIRNGSFAAGLVGWNRQASDGLFGIQLSEAADRDRSGQGVELNVGGDLVNLIPATSQILQLISLPDQITKMEFSMNFLPLGTNGGFGVGGLTAQLVVQSVATGEFMEVLPLAQWSSDGSAAITEDWFSPAVSLDEEQLKPFIEGQAAGNPVQLIVSLSGWSLRSLVDSISVKLTGSRTVPQLGQGIVYSRFVGLGQWELRVVRIDGRGDRLLHRFSSASPPGRPAWVRALPPADDVLGVSFTQGSPFSRFNQDVVWFDGQQLARISNPPTIAEVQADPRPTGRVRVTVSNVSIDRTLTASVWVEGSKSPIVTSASLAPGQSDTVELPEVVDLGAGVSQYIALRNFETGHLENVVNTVDVVAGGVAEVNVNLSGTSTSSFRATHHTWRADRSEVIASVSGVLTSFERMGGVGAPLNVFGSHPVMAPNDNRVLVLSGLTLSLIDLEGEQTSPLLQLENAWSPVWFGNGRRFLYIEGVVEGDVAIYDLDQGGSERITLLHRLFEEGLSAPTLSADDQWMVIERRLGASGAGAARELWVYSLENPFNHWPLVTEEDPQQPLWGR